MDEVRAVLSLLSVWVIVLRSDIVWPSVGPDEPGVLDKKGFQNLRFKLIPNMVEAPWVVQMAVS